MAAGHGSFINVQAIFHCLLLSRPSHFKTDSKYFQPDICARSIPRSFAASPVEVFYRPYTPPPRTLSLLYKWQCIYALPWGRCYNIYEDNVYRHYSSLKNWKGHTWSYTYSNIWIFAYIWSNTFGQVWPVSVSPGTGVVTSPNSKIFFTVIFF